MSLINRLIREASLGATVLNIKPNEVSKIAVHCKACMTNRLTVGEIELHIKRGSVTLAGVQLKVLGLTSSSAPSR